ncbi:MAG: hypothetical protein EOO71_17480 [Myxococcaceae bacterium]|nr:MAG: hypothetical protein EOO71_17480 [Myxococcaceae bacterium]
MKVEQVEVEIQQLVYSHTCKAITSSMSSLGQVIQAIPIGGEESIQIKPYNGSTDGGSASLKHIQTLTMFGCGSGIEESIKNEDGLGPIHDASGNKRNATPDCSTEAPCSIITYIEARAMHPKLFQWAGPFDTIFVQAPDQTHHSAWSFGSTDDRGNRSFHFTNEADRFMFLQTAKYIGRHRKMWGWNDDAINRYYPKRSFGGLGVFRAVGVEEPKR